MTRTRWLLAALSFAAALAASAWVVASSWPRAGGTLALPALAIALAAAGFATELAARAGKILLSARALGIPLRPGAALRVCLGGDFGAAVTPARSGGEPARFLVLAEAGVAPAPALLILFFELFLELWSLVVVIGGLAVAFRGAGRALDAVIGLMGGYAAVVLGAGAVGVLLARRGGHGPPPRWARRVGLHAGRWRAVQRALRQLRASVGGVRHARRGPMLGALLLSIVHIVGRAAILPGLVLGAGYAIGSRAELAPLVLWPLALQYGGVVVPVPAGGGAVEAAFDATLRGAIPPAIFGATLVWWRMWTFYVYILLGALAAGRTALRALRPGAVAHGAPSAAGTAPATPPEPASRPAA